MALKLGMHMGRTWVLDTETKGTGANMVPLENSRQAKPAPARQASGAAAKTSGTAPKTSGTKRARRPREPVETTATPLPPGHVRKKSTGEIGKVRSVDPKAGTASVHWLKRGAASTVPLSAISRR
jgi:hypothetical protein